MLTSWLVGCIAFTVLPTCTHTALPGHGLIRLPRYKGIRAASLLMCAVVLQLMCFSLRFLVHCLCSVQAMQLHMLVVGGNMAWYVCFCPRRAHSQVCATACTWPSSLGSLIAHLALVGIGNNPCTVVRYTVLTMQRTWHLCGPACFADETHSTDAACAVLYLHKAYTWFRVGAALFLPP